MQSYFENVIASEKRIFDWQKQKGIQSIINFRGESNQGAFLIEKNMCKELGVELINIKLYSSKLPEKEKIFEINEVFKNIQKPFPSKVINGENT